jgi:hypothetical protein
LPDQQQHPSLKNDNYVNKEQDHEEGMTPKIRIWRANIIVARSARIPEPGT